MDTSVLLCPVNGTMITPRSVIQSRTFCLSPMSPMPKPMLPWHHGNDPMLEQHNRSNLQKFYNFFTIVKLFEELAKNLDGIEVKE